MRTTRALRDILSRTLEPRGYIGVFSITRNELSSNRDRQLGIGLRRLLNRPALDADTDAPQAAGGRGAVLQNPKGTSRKVSADLI